MQILPVAMTSLPIPACVSELPLRLGSEMKPGGEDKEFLLQAFSSFADAAVSLERCYGTLRSEVERLERELAASNSGLRESLEQNRRMRESLDQILESLPCGVLVVADDGEILRANPQASAVMAASAGNGADKVDGRFQALDPALRRLLEQSRNRTEEQEGSLGEGKTERWLAVRHASLVHEKSGGSVFILQDVTERKQLEQVREKLRREQALAEMSAMLAHEVRNPLGSMELFAGLLAEGGLEGDSRKWVEHLQAGLRTLAATVNNVLHFHSLPRPELVPLEMGQVLDWVGEFFAPLARREHVEILVKNHLAGVTMAADRHRLEQVLSNLVLNAVKAMPGGGWIRIAGRKQDSEIVISVADSGPGISPENLGRLFDPGFTTREGSPGLGLAVCRKIVEQHGGAIEVNSRPGEGAAFTLRFPLAGTAAREKAAKEKE